MSNSKLVSYTKISPNSSVRTSPISKITIHHAAVVNASLNGMGNGFASPARKASANYGIDSNGKIALYVDESRRAWTSSNSNNDDMAVTIEVANSKGAPNWEISDKALAALIDLCVDICERNNIKKLVYSGDKSGNLTRHNMFTATACPGPYLQSKFQYIADEVNKRLGQTQEKAPTMVSIALPLLERGCKGNEVKTLQRLLLALKKYDLGGYGADGSFGPATESAVIQFQKDKGLDADGVVGSDTWNALLRG